MRYIIAIICLILSAEAWSQETSTTIIPVEISWPDTFSMSFGWFGDEEGIGLNQPAQYAAYEELSEPIWKERVYYYQPLESYIGADTAMLVAQTGSDGASKPTNIDTTIIVFNANGTNNISALNLTHQYLFHSNLMNTIELSSPGLITIYSSNGQVMLSEAGNSFTISDLSMGFYIAVASWGSDQKMIKFFK